MTDTAKLFMHGRSQAVRLPKEFRFEGRAVHIARVGNKVILEPMEDQPMPWTLIDQTGDSLFMAKGPEITAMPENRVVFDL